MGRFGGESQGTRAYGTSPVGTSHAPAGGHAASSSGTSSRRAAMTVVTLSPAALTGS